MIRHRRFNSVFATYFILLTQFELNSERVSDNGLKVHTHPHGRERIPILRFFPLRLSGGWNGWNDAVSQPINRHSGQHFGSPGSNSVHDDDVTEELLMDNILETPVSTIDAANVPSNLFSSNLGVSNSEYSAPFDGSMQSRLSAVPVLSDTVQAKPSNPRLDGPDGRRPTPPSRQPSDHVSELRAQVGSVNPQQTGERIVNPQQIGERIQKNWERLNCAVMTLNDRAGEWALRLKTLQEIRSLILDLNLTSCPERVATIQKLSECLCSQLEDKRSQLVKECCLTISSVAPIMSENYEAGISKLIQRLLQLTYVTVKVISTSAHECLSALTGLVNPATMILELDRGSQDDHVSMRSRCSEYLLQLLRDKEESDLSDFADTISTLLTRSLNDNAVSVRNVGKECFTFFAKKFPNLAMDVASRTGVVMRSQLLRKTQVSSTGTTPGRIISPESGQKPRGFRDFGKVRAKNAVGFVEDESGDDAKEAFPSSSLPSARKPLSAPRGFQPLSSPYPLPASVTGTNSRRSWQLPIYDTGLNGNNIHTPTPRRISTGRTQDLGEVGKRIEATLKDMNLKFEDTDSDSDVDENCFSSMSNMNLMGVLGLAREQTKLNAVVHLNLSSEVSKGMPVALDPSPQRPSTNQMYENEQNTSDAPLLSPNFSMLSTVDEIIKTLGEKASSSPKDGIAKPFAVDGFDISEFAQNSNLLITSTLGSAPPSRFRRSRLPRNVSQRVARDLPSTVQSFGVENAFEVQYQDQNNRTTVPSWYLDRVKTTLRPSHLETEGVDSLLHACEDFVRARLPTGPLDSSLVPDGGLMPSADYGGVVNQLSREQVLELELEMYKAASGMLWEKLCAWRSNAEKREAELRNVTKIMWFSMCSLEVLRIFRESPPVREPTGSPLHNLTASVADHNDVNDGGGGYEAERVRRIERNRRAMADFGLAGSPVRDKGKNAGLRKNKGRGYADPETEEEDLSFSGDETLDDTYELRNSEADSGLSEEESNEIIDEKHVNQRENRRSGISERDGVGSGSHPSLVDPEEPGLGPADRFRAELVRAVYESEGTSEAEALMESSVPSVVARAFREVGWQEGQQILAKGGDGVGRPTRVRATSGGGPKPNRALLTGDSEDSAGPGMATDLGNIGDGAGGADSVEGSASLSSARKRLRDMEWDEPAAAAAAKVSTGQRSGKLRRPTVRRRKDPERVAAIAAAAAAQGQERSSLARGSWCRRTGVTGKYYTTQNKYLCNNCGRAGHVKRTCDMPPRVLDSALEALGWQVMEVSRKNGAAIEKFYVPPDRGSQLRGLAKLLKYLDAAGRSLEDIYTDAGQVAPPPAAAIT